jgi:hypothetical protein
MLLLDCLEWITERTADAQGGAEEAFWTGKSEAIDGRSEGVVFIKPEVTSAGVQALRNLVELTAAKFAAWGVDLQEVGVLGWRYLESRNLTGAHYGVINRVSREGIDALQEETKLKLRALGWSDEPVLGGHQFMARYPEFTPATLSVLWDNLNQQSERIAPGTYAIRVQVLSEFVWLLNGFHPYQLEHFNAPGKAIVVMLVRSKADWGALRTSLIGETDPTKAEAESIRATLLRNAADWGIPVVNKGLNGIHFSAGPLEGMVELLRFRPSAADARATASSDTNFGAQLEAELGPGSAERFAKNPDLSIDGASISAFDATEGKNPAEAIEILRKNYP